MKTDGSMSETCNSWTLYFDGSSSSKNNAGAGIVLEAETGKHERYHKDLGPNLTCNKAKYATLIAGLEIAKGKQVNDLKVAGDSKLVYKQVAGEWQVKSEKLQPLHQAVEELKSDFSSISFTHIPRHQNQLADELSRLHRGR